MKVLGLAGWSGSGKTTLIRDLLPRLIADGRSVSTIKHAHHGFDIDQPGKDSHQHRQAGAAEVLVVSERRWALMHELRDEAEPSLDALLAHLAPVDLVLVEGFKRGAWPKLEVHRPSLGKPLLATEDPHILAVIADAPVSGLRVPRLDRDDLAAIVRFVQGFLDG